MIDYKQLLIRYIEHIKCIEGIDFIDKSQPDGKEILSEDDICILLDLRWKDAAGYIFDDETKK